MGLAGPENRGGSALSQSRARRRQKRLQGHGIQAELTPAGQAHARRALPKSERSTDQNTLRTIERQRNAAFVAQSARRLSAALPWLECVGECAQVTRNLRR